MLSLIRAIVTYVSKPPSSLSPQLEALKVATKNDVLFTLEDEQYLQVIGRAFAKELDCLKNARDPVESGGKGAPLGSLKASATPSRLLYDGTDYPEVNRTLVSTLALKWIITGNYAKFTENQVPATKLKPESFQNLSAFFQENHSLAAKTQDVLTLLVAIVVNDLGKDPTLADEVAAATHQPGLSKENHDEVIYAAEKAYASKQHRSHFVPSLSLLDADHREDLHLGLKLGSKLNPAQLAQGECVPGSLQGVLNMRGHERAFTIKFMELLLDVAGAQGHVDARGAKVMTEPVFQGYMNTYTALSDIVAGRATLREGYDQVLVKRGDMLRREGFHALGVKSGRDRALLRILLMSRTDGRAQAEMIEEAFDELGASVRQTLIDGLIVDGLEDGQAILPYYMPACFAEGLRNTDGSKDGKRRAAGALMEFLAEVVEGTKTQPDLGSGGIVERDLSFASVVIKGESFRNDPVKALAELKIPWVTV